MSLVLNYLRYETLGGYGGGGGGGPPEENFEFLECRRSNLRPS